jgi:hypothetical protein
MKIPVIFLFLILGFLIGTTAGEITSMLIPERLCALQVFAPAYHAGFQPVFFDLDVLNFTIGISVKVNFFSWIGLLITALLLLFPVLGTGSSAKNKA